MIEWEENCPPRGASVKWRPVKALVKTKREPGLWLQDVPEPKPGPGDVLLRVLRTGICGTDLHIESWNEWAQHTIKPPLVVGHEFVGEVVELGEGVASVFPGRSEEHTSELQSPCNLVCR